jgi:tripartite ATP-independent transporter DctM subunit
MILLLFVLLALLIFFGFPIAFATGISALIVLLLLDLPISVAITQTFAGVDNFTLLAIPFFILAGEVMAEAQIVEQIVNFANALVGRLRGGLGHVNIVGSMIFAGISGSGVADASAIGSITIPSMIKQGYAKDFSVAVNSSAATIGPIIPPSIPMILWATLTMQSIGAMFLGGVIPGFIIGFGLMAMNYIVCTRREYDFRQEGKFSVKRVVITFFRSFGALIMPLIIVGGIISGLFTATEAGAVAVVYGFLFGTLVSRTLKLHHIPKLLLNAATTSAMVYYIIALATIFSNLLARLNFQQVVINALLNFTRDPLGATLLVIVFLLALGCFLDPVPMIIMFAPTLQALGIELGYHPVHYGVLMVIVMLIGAVTPPVGALLFVSCSIAKIGIDEAAYVLLPFIIVLVLASLIVLFVPQTVLWIPNLLHFG